jgi:SanA protein
MKYVRYILGLTLLIGIIVLVGANIWVVSSTRHLVFTHAEALPEYPVGLVPGTSHRLTSGRPNPYFHNRIKAAAALYHAGKIKHIIVSGDNRSKYYNEPLEMKKALIANGVPASAITADYAGLRTLDSVVRSKKIFGQQRIIVITQLFHAYRALFICRHEGIDAAAFATENEETGFAAWREYLARMVTILDLYVFNTQPKFLGQPEPVLIEGL